MTELPSARTPGPDHAAKATGIWANAPFRTVVQGVATDVGVAVAFVVYDSLNSGATDYRLLFLSVLKTALMTGASYVMKRKKPA